MSNLIIIGASAMGREVFQYALDCGMTVKGFLDSRKNILAGYGGYPKILSSPETYKPLRNDVFVCAIGDADQRQKYAELMEKKDAHFVSIVHPKAFIGRNVSIGVGCIVCPNSSITADVQVGNHVIVNVNSSISHDCKIGDYATLSPGCHVAGWCDLGSATFLGINSSLIPHVTTGHGVYVAGGAIVIHSVERGLVMGIPAKPRG